MKDHLENHLHDLVCAGQVPLPEAQQAIRGDWRTANAKYGALPVRPRPTASAPTQTIALGPRPVAPQAPAPAYTPPSTAAPAPQQPAASAQGFANCTDMHGTYPHGVGLPDAVDHTASGKNPVTNFYRNADLYNANSGSDADGDGIACERR